MQKRKKSPAKRTVKADVWQNIATGLGTVNDKRTAGALALEVVTDREARDLWRGNDLAKRIIEDVVKEALRNSLYLKMDDKELAEEIMTELESIPGPMHIGPGLCAALTKARQFERAYGGSAIFPVINDSSGDLAEPLDEQRIGAIQRFQVFEPRELRPLDYYTDPTHPKFGEPSSYQVTPIGTRVVTDTYQSIHESRLVIFPGVRVTRETISGVLDGWGDNVLTPVRSVLNDFELSFGGAAHLLQDFAQAILKLNGLAEIMGMEETAKTRLSEMNQWRSVLRALVLDSEDSFERVTTPLTGYSDILDRLMYRLAAAANMPVSRLMGMAPAGLNATGEADRSFWYDTVQAEQQYLTPFAERLGQLFMLSQESPTQGKEPDVWSIEFESLWQPSEKETAEARKLQAETDKIYIETMVLSPEEVARSRFGGDSYSFETSVDFDERAAMEPPPAEEAPPAPDKAIEMMAEEPPPNEDGIRIDYIKHVGDQWIVYSSEGKILGRHPTEAEAKKQLSTIEAAKHVSRY